MQLETFRCTWFAVTFIGLAVSSPLDSKISPEISAGVKNATAHGEYFFIPRDTPSTFGLQTAGDSAKTTAPPEAFIVLSEHLADLHHTRRDVSSAEMKLPQTIAVYRKAVRDLFAIAATSDDSALAALANESAEAGLDMLIQLKLLEALPKPPEADELMAEGLVRLLFRGFGILGRVEEIYRQDANLQNTFRALIAASERREQAQLKLPALAAKYAGPPFTVGNAVTVDFDETWLPERPDWIALVNNTGATLHHCSIAVELQGKNQATKQNLHFIREWAPAVAIYGEYAGSVKVQDKTLRRASVPLVQNVKVSLWSDELSQENLIYNYAGAERNKDIAQYLTKMNFVSYYRRFEKGVFFDTPRRVELWLRGVELPRPHKMIIHFHRGETVKSLEWLFTAWKQDERKILETRPGDLPWDPDWYSLEIYFSDVDYTWTDTRRLRP